jgi:hypothetical protein
MEGMIKVEQAGMAVGGLAQLKRQFGQWRAGRKRGERIPAELWAGAVSLVGELGVYRVAADLHLDHAVLKRRAAPSADKAPAASATPRFVELFTPPAHAVAIAAAAPAPECVLELTNARGTKMRVELAGNGLGALAGLCRAFVEAA